MHKYMFVLGRDPELSVAELLSYLITRGINYEILEWTKSIVFLECEKLNPNKVINELGGIAKIGELLEDLDNYNLYSGGANKIKYAISDYSGENIEGLRNYLKEKFREDRIKATYKRSQYKEPFLTPSEVMKHNLIIEGAELLVFKDYLARTLAVFNPEEYKIRDLQRPKQAPLLSVSIRLAKILINLSGAKAGKKLLDPFCGVGTVVQESLMMGIEAIGMDINKESLESARINLEWLKKKYNLNTPYRIIFGDATNLSRFVKDKVDCIATEPYLGPLIKKKPTIEEAKKQLNSLKRIYEPFILEAAKVLKEKGKITLIVPRFRTWDNKLVTMNFSEILEKANLKPYSPNNQIKMPIIYRPPKGRIEREIWIAEQKL